MPLKRVTYISYGDDEKCRELREYIEGTGMILQIRDLGKNPMERDELSKLIGHVDMKHFLDPSSPSYAKNDLGKKLPSRDELLDLIASDNSLLKRPIILTNRLLTIGCDKQLVSQMLQISSNGTVENVEGRAGMIRSNHIGSSRSRNSGRRSSAGAASK